MGKSLEFNWILKLEDKYLPKKNFFRGDLIEFSKEGERIYLTQIPTFLVNKDWDALAIVYIRDSHSYEGFTSGSYIIEEILNENEKSVLSGLLKKMYKNK